MFKGKLANVNAIVNFAQISSKEGNMLDDYNTVQSLITVSHLNLNELRSKKEIIWTNLLTYRPRLKEDL